MEQFAWSQDIQEREKELDDFMKKKEKLRHAEYYQKNRKRLCQKQRMYNRIADRSTYSKKYWEKNKEELKRKHRETYWLKRDERREYSRKYYEEHKEEIKARRRLKKEREKEHELQQGLS